MVKLLFVTGLAAGFYVSPSFGADCTPTSSDPAALVTAIKCLQQNAIQKGDSVKLSLSSGLCPVTPSDVGGQYVTTNTSQSGIPLSSFTLLQNCSGAPSATITK
jgi:hypothetical protein